MRFSYRTRKFFSGLATFLLALVLVAAVVWMVWVVWLDRFVVYSRDGAHFQFDMTIQAGQPALPPQEQVTVPIFYNDGSSGEEVISTDLRQLNGYYADAEALKEDLAAVRRQIEALPPDTPVLIDVKNVNGYFFYSSNVGPTTDTLSVRDMDALIQYLVSSDHYVIARLPALRDFYFGLNATENGLFHTSRGYLFADEDNIYWLDPTQEGTMNYLTQTVNELKRKGFDEVVLADFCFPDTKDIWFEGDQREALSAAANTLATVLTSENFCLSFLSEDPFFPLPTQQRTRLYLENITAVGAAGAAQALGLDNPQVRVVFLTELGDNRYDEYGVLRPLVYAKPEA